MNSDLEQLFRFTRRERRGLITLLCVLILILGVAHLYDYKKTQPESFEKSRTLAAAWERYQSTHTIRYKEGHSGEAILPLHGFPFDPNTLDSSGFIRLGLDPAIVRRLLHWRNKGKVFHSADDFSALYGLSDDMKAALRPYIQITSRSEQRHYQKFEQEALPAHLDLNTIDSETLVRVDGIGPYLAHKIITQRQALGSFLSNSQLSEIHRFPDSVLKRLQQQLVIKESSVRKIRLNEVTEAELARHPYIGAQMAKNIILMRSGLRKYEKTEQLRQVPLMNEEKYRKIAPYCIIE